ncbi:DUF2779 domain-containing protein, partial [bacterium]|nr:DUF2779 domain-containing protein [bacterium]
MRRLSKSRYQTGLQCERALWLATHTPECADPIGESQQWVFDQGTEVGRLAQGLFPGGTEVTEGHRETESALATTARLLAQETSVLYEPAFYFDGVLVRVDVLVRVGDEWDLYEVKSSSRVKDQHITDAAVQTYVIEGCGLPVRRSGIVHLNTGYIYEGGEYDLARLFTIEDVTADVRAYLPGVPSQLARFREMLEGPEPEVAIGAHCRSPYTCSYSGYCHAFLPREHPITELPRISEGALHSLLDAGITCIGDIPDSFTGLSASQARTRDAIVRGEPAVDLDGLRSDLARLTWPLYHLDFETVNPGLPLWAGTRPYQA